MLISVVRFATLKDVYCKERERERREGEREGERARRERGEREGERKKERERREGERGRERERERREGERGRERERERSPMLISVSRFATLKDVYCKDSIRLGHEGDGGWDMCLTGPYHPRNDCLVYSFGYGN